MQTKLCTMPNFTNYASAYPPAFPHLPIGRGEGVLEESSEGGASKNVNFLE